MKFIVKIGLGLLLLGIVFAALIGSSIISNAGGRYVQLENEKGVNSEVTHFYMVKEPLGKAITTVSPGDHVYFAIERTRTTSCLVDVDWRWVKVIAPNVVVGWPVDGSKSFAGTGYALGFEYSTVPASLSSGSYTVQRVAAYDCGLDHKINDVHTLAIEVK